MTVESVKYSALHPFHITTMTPQECYDVCGAKFTLGRSRSCGNELHVTDIFLVF